MRWGEMRRSENVEDRSGARPRGGGIGGGGMKIGLGGIILVLIASVLFGINPFTLLGGMSGPEPAPQSAPPGYGPQVRPGAATKSADPTKEMVARVLGDTEDVWNALFQAMFNKGYPKPGLGHLRGPGPLHLRLRQRRRRSVLLPGRRQGLPRYGVLRPVGAALRCSG